MTSLLIARRSPHDLQLLIYAALAGLFMAALAPFGTWAADIGARLIYWVPLLLLSWPLIATGKKLAELKVFSAELTTTIALHVVCILILALPMTVITSLWSSTIFDVPFRPDRWPNLYRNVVPFAAVLLLLELLRQPRTRAARDAIAIGLPPALSARLPLKLRHASLIALNAQDHYVQVFTSAGDALIHARFADVLAAVRGLDGAQVHRSWWIARDAIAKVERRRGRSLVLLSNGLRAPVSRRFRPSSII